VADRRTRLTPSIGVDARKDRAGAQEARRPGSWRVWTRRLGTWLAATLLLLIAASVAGLLPLQIMRVASGSMTPTIAVGDLVVVERSHGPVRRMDVVAMKDPHGGPPLVKRAVALGGDSVGIEAGVLGVNGAKVCERPVDPPRIEGVYFGPVPVPAGHLFLLGDERNGSVDSRDFGPLPNSALIGRVQVRLWSTPGSLPSDRC